MVVLVTLREKYYKTSDLIPIHWVAMAILKNGVWSRWFVIVELP